MSFEKRKKRAKAISFVLAQSRVSHAGSIQPWMSIISFPSCLLVYYSAQPRALSWFCLFTKAQKKSKSLFSGSPSRIAKRADSGKKNQLTLITSCQLHATLQGLKCSTVHCAVKEVPVLLKSLHYYNQLATFQWLSRYLIFKIIFPCFEVVRML